MSHLLIVDDESSICWGLAKLAESLGHSSTTAATAEAALEAAAIQKPDVIVLDVRLPGISGLEAMERFRQTVGPAPIIIITAFGDLETAVQAVRNGAFEYLLKPFDLSAAQRAIIRAVEHSGRSNQHAEPVASKLSGNEGVIVGHSAAIQDVFKRIALVSNSDACVHIRGESGSGKELVARAIHRYSRRAAGPFVAVNIAALSPALAESELFGHVRGAFTGAEQSRKGLLEQAHGGTIFLDEVADIPLSLQVKLLRVLEHGEILPIGASRPVHSDFRLISATHQNLKERVSEGGFRHDLYYRLITFEIEIPPLRERLEDVPELVNHFLDVLSAKNQQPRPEISDEAITELQRRPWLGNVRELRNAIEHALVLARAGIILPEHLPPPLESGEGKADAELAIVSLVRRWADMLLTDPAGAEDLYDRLVKVVERPLLLAAMEHCGGQCLAAARRLGLHRTTLRKKLDEIGDAD